MPKTLIEDGFGDEWAKCSRPDCDLHVVRPGEVQCAGDYDRIGCVYDQPLLAEMYHFEVRRLQALLDYACGYISTVGEWTGTHPMQVLQWLEESLSEDKED